MGPRGARDFLKKQLQKDEFPEKNCHKEFNLWRKELQCISIQFWKACRFILIVKLYYVMHKKIISVSVFHYYSMY